MSLNLNHATILQLQRGDLHAIDGLWLTVLEGRVWVTQADDPQDHFIGPGGALRLAPGCGALLGAEGAARVRLVPLAASAAKPALTAVRPAWLRGSLRAALGVPLGAA